MNKVELAIHLDSEITSVEYWADFWSNLAARHGHSSLADTIKSLAENADVSLRQLRHARNLLNRRSYDE